MIDRRRFVIGGASSLPLCGASAVFGTATAASTSSALQSGLKAIVQLGGRRYVYDAAQGRDMGPYIGEYVKQHCVLVSLPDLPLTVFFRPDIDSDRVELVVELGRMWEHRSGGRPAHILDPYTVEFMRGDKSLATIDVPYHWWWSRWRWQSLPRTSSW